ncbi:MAG: hypothetical protein WC749_02490 [Dehalococcoidia bacterium]
MKTRLIQTAALIAAFFAVLWLMPEPAPVEPDPQTQALQAEISQLRAQGEKFVELSRLVSEKMAEINWLMLAFGSYRLTYSIVIERARG